MYFYYNLLNNKICLYYLIKIAKILSNLKLTSILLILKIKSCYKLIFENSIIPSLGSRNVPQNFGPDRFSRFDVNLIQTNTQAKYTCRRSSSETKIQDFSISSIKSILPFLSGVPRVTSGTRRRIKLSASRTRRINKPRKINYILGEQYQLSKYDNLLI